jgi:putative addiction module killer protein
VLLYPLFDRALEIVAYRDPTDRCPFGRWLDDLEPLAAAKVTAALVRMAHGSLGDVKSVGSGVLERRIHWSAGYRVYFGRDGARLIVLLAGGTKDRQRRDIDIAQARWADYKARRHAQGD